MAAKAAYRSRQAGNSSTDRREVSVVPPTSTPTSPLINEWLLVFYLDTEERYATLLPGTNINAVFDEDRSLTGFSGCNTYHTIYDDKPPTSLAISPITSAAQICEAPDSIMQQESTYLDLLADVTLYRMNGNHLELYNNNGDKVLIFTSNP